MKNIIEPKLIAEFKKKPPSYETISKLLESHPDMSAASLCTAIGFSVEKYYDWKYRQKQSLVQFDARLGKLPVPPLNLKDKKYSASDKVAIIREYGRLENGSKTEFLRKMGLYQTDVRKWSELVDAAAIEALSNRKVRKDKKSDSEVEALKKENRYQEKTIAKLAALVVFQKKVSDILESSD